MGFASRIFKLLAAAVVLLFPCMSSAQELTVGVIGTSSDAPFYIADKRGYFRDAGLSVKFVRFDSAAKAMAPLGTGQLEVASGATSAGLYNAVTRGIGIKIVADKARNAKGYGFTAFMVRKDLIDSGRVKSFKDFKGLKVAVSALGSSESFLLAEALRQNGLALDDVERVNIGFSQHVVAFENRAIDASISVEPAITAIVNAGKAVRFVGVDEIYPDYQTAVTFYGDKFVAEKPKAARGFMTALVHGMRDYADALQNGRLAGPGADAIIAIMAEYSPLRDPALYRAMTSHYCDPDGQVNIEALRRTWAFFKDNKQIDGTVTVDQIIDTSFAKAAVVALGPYVRKNAAR